MTRTQIATMSALKRFARVVIPQLPAICAYLAGIKPEWAATLSFLGAVATALDKFLRELKVGWYIYVFGE
jgi:hypothetical protein